MIDRDAGLETNVTIWNSPAPGARAGGDWCVVVPLGEDIIAVTLGDVSGHGEAAATCMRIMRAEVVRGIRQGCVPSDILAAANAEACRYGDGVIVSAIVAFVNTRNSTLTFANAGHPPPLMLSSRGPVLLQRESADLTLGIARDYHAHDVVVALPIDALIVLYTDGITEHARDPVRGEAELVAAAQVVYAQSGSNAARDIAQRVLRAGRGVDDAAAIAIRTMPTASRAATTFTTTVSSHASRATTAVDASIA